MKFEKNHNKEVFKEAFFVLLKSVKYGDFLDDSQLLLLASRNSARLSMPAIQACIRELETQIGDTYQMHLRRERSSGYTVLEPKEQSTYVAQKGGKKIHRAVKRTHKQLGHVNVDALDPNTRDEHLNRFRGFAAMKQIICDSVKQIGIQKPQVKLLEDASNELRALKMFKK